MKTNGLLFGKFAPLTRGHVSCIVRAATHVDNLYVVLCYDQKFNDSLDPQMSEVLSLRNRHLWLLKTFSKHTNIHISVIDESSTPPYPDGETDFTQLIRERLMKQYGVECISQVFSSEPSYGKYFAKNFPESKHILIDPKRKLVPISATKVREDVYGNWEFLSQAARKDFVKTVVVIGSESTGKSTLVRQLGDHFSTVSVPEVGRLICEDEFYSHEEYMNEMDYIRVAQAHNLQEERARVNANKVLLSDTNNLVTEYSAACMGLRSDILKAMSAAEQYDLVLFLDIDVPWVGDNLRRNGDPRDRQRTNKLLLQMCHERNVKNMIHVNGTFTERFDQSVAAINTLLGGVR